MGSKIYTRKGDLGLTSLFSGEKVAKDDFRLQAYGALDELQAQLGMARALTKNEELGPILIEIQRDISAACAELASNPERARSAARHIERSDTERLETCIDSFTSRYPLPSASSFRAGPLTAPLCILPAPFAGGRSATSSPSTAKWAAMTRSSYTSTGSLICCLCWVGRWKSWPSWTMRYRKSSVPHSDKA